MCVGENSPNRRDFSSLLLRPREQENCCSQTSCNGEIPWSRVRLIALNWARCAWIEKKMVVQGLGDCLKVVSERHGHVSASVSGGDQTPQGFVVRPSTDYSYWMSRAQWHWLADVNSSNNSPHMTGSPTRIRRKCAGQPCGCTACR